MKNNDIDNAIKFCRNCKEESLSYCNPKLAEEYEKINTLLQELKHLKNIYSDAFDPEESVCSNCRKRVHHNQTQDSPEEDGCMGIEANLWTIGGCKEYEQ